MSTPYIELERRPNDYAVVCRGCLAATGEMKNMVEWGLLENYFIFADVQKENNEGISELLCTRCEDMLLKCAVFRKQCQDADFVLRSSAKKVEPEDILTAVAMEIECKNSSENKLTFEFHHQKLIINIISRDMESKIYLPCPYTEQCEVKFLKKKYLFTHLKQNHSIEDSFKIDLKYYCSFDQCSYNMNSNSRKFFTERKFLNQHYNKVHEEKKYHCQKCGFKAAKKSDYDRHIETCNITFLCQICNTEYKNNERFLVHLKRKHPDVHKEYKDLKKTKKPITETVVEGKRARTDLDKFYICHSPKRSFATQTLNIEENIKNDVTLPSWQSKHDNFEIKTDEISTQTVFEDLLSLKSQTSEDESLFFSETVSLSDIQTQTFPVEFGLSRSNKETITSETQSPDLSIKETQTCVCLYDSPKFNLRLFESVSSSPSSSNFTSTETQTLDFRHNLKSDVMLGFNSAETQTCFEEGLSKDSL